MDPNHARSEPHDRQRHAGLLDPEGRKHVIAFLRDFRKLCQAHRAYTGPDGSLELSREGRGSFYFTGFCGNQNDAGCFCGDEHIVDADLGVFVS